VASGLEKSKAEPLGLVRTKIPCCATIYHLIYLQTFGLDLLGMYEMAADHYFTAGVYARALEFVASRCQVTKLSITNSASSLYFMSNVKTTKLVQKFLEVGRVDVVITRLRTALENPRGT